MRRDIHVNTQLGDIVLQDRNILGTYPFEWIGEEDLVLKGQLTLPGNYDINTLYSKGVRVSIPYTPIYKPMQIRIVRDYGDGVTRTVINPVNRSEWFDIRTKLYGKSDLQIRAPQLLMISMGDYLIQIDNNTAYIWSNIDSDLCNINANYQNRNLLLQCVPSNNYRYPTSGVGLVRFLHSNLSQAKLADKLDSEFKADKVTVKNASFNSFTGNLEMDLDFTEADASVYST